MATKPKNLLPKELIVRRINDHPTGDLIIRQSLADAALDPKKVYMVGIYELKRVLNIRRSYTIMSETKP